MSNTSYSKVGPIFTDLVIQHYMSSTKADADAAIALEDEPTTVVLSGGMDSTVLLYLAYNLRSDVRAISFDYGQRHKKELEMARQTCKLLGVPHVVVDLKTLGATLKSALLYAEDVPEGLYDEDNMKSTIVPNRNMIMLSAAAGYAISNGSSGVATAVHAGDHAVYPDCRPEFIDAADNAIQVGTDRACHLIAPFVSISKAAIASIGDYMNVMWRYTWSCYKGGDKHCGKCGTCTERIEAFRNAGVADGVDYEAEGYRWAVAELRRAGKIEAIPAD